MPDHRRNGSSAHPREDQGADNGRYTPHAFEPDGVRRIEAARDCVHVHTAASSEDAECDGHQPLVMTIQGGASHTVCT